MHPITIHPTRGRRTPVVALAALMLAGAALLSPGVAAAQSAELRLFVHSGYGNGANDITDRSTTRWKFLAGAGGAVGVRDGRLHGGLRTEFLTTVTEHHRVRSGLWLGGDLFVRPRWSLEVSARVGLEHFWEIGRQAHISTGPDIDPIGGATTHTLPYLGGALIVRAHSERGGFRDAGLWIEVTSNTERSVGEVTTTGGDRTWRVGGWTVLFAVWVGLF